MAETEQTYILTIDKGNSSAKVMLWQGDTPVRGTRLEGDDIEPLLPFLEGVEVEACVYCSVGHKDAKFLETLRRLVEGNLLVMTASTPLPIGVIYKSRETLGSDRVAAAAGAAEMTRGGAMVVDCGTAMTLDVLTPSNEFAGGNITPGMSMRLHSLHDLTSRLPLVEPKGDVPEFGYDTATAIRSGVVMGMADEICGAYRRAAKTYGCRNLVMTGTDAAEIIPLLRNEGLDPIFEPNLVGLGLLSILKASEIDV